MIRIHVLSLLAVAATSFAGTAHDPAPAYRIEQSGRGFAASNADEGLTVLFREGGAEFTHRTGKFRLSLAGEAMVSRAVAHANRIEFTRGAMTEWFVNGSSGIEQGFTVRSRRGSGSLQIELEVRGDFVPVAGHDSVALVRDGKTMLRYAGLRSWDAAGRSLPSRVAVQGSRISLIVDDTGAQYPVTVDPVIQETIITAADGVTGDAFGNGVSVSGDTALVTAPGDGGGVAKVYVMARAGNSWSNEAVLKGADSVAGQGFGASVAVDGDTAVVGAYFANSGNGAAYVFVRSGGQWAQQAKLTAANGQFQDFFGWSVAISGDTILVGAPQPEINFGTAYVFTRSGTTWAQQAQLTPDFGQLSDFGYSVAVNGDTVAVGATGLSGADRGFASVYLRSGTLWTQEARLTGSDTLGNLGAMLSFGASVAVTSDTLVVGAPWCARPEFNFAAGCGSAQPGAAYVFTNKSGSWTQEAKLSPADSANGDKFGAAVALNQDTAVVGAPTKNPGSGAGAGASYLFLRTSGVWSPESILNPVFPSASGDAYGSAVSFAGDTVLIGAPGYSGKGGAYVWRLSNVSLQSSPSGQTLTLSGTGCGTPGTFTAPYSGFWTNCAVQWNSPNVTGTGVRTTFENWTDSSGQNPRSLTLSPNVIQTASVFTGNFGTEYYLTTQSAPVSAGTVTNAGWYLSGSSVSVSALPNSGFVFTGFSGALTGPSSPQLLVMNGPRTVTGSFTNTPAAVLTGLISAKSGPVTSRSWTISLMNAGPGVAFNAQMFVLSFTQTFGTACSALPIRLMPATLPLSLGTINPGSGMQAPVTIDFSGCPANARFTVNLGYMSNGGASGGLIQLVNQFQ